MDVIAAKAGIHFDSRAVPSMSQAAPLPAALSVAERPSHFSLLVQREVTKRKDTPEGAPSGHPALQVRRWATGFFDRASCPDEKLARLHAGHPAGFPSPTCRALWGPVSAHPCAHSSPALRAGKASRVAVLMLCMQPPLGGGPQPHTKAVIPAKAGIHLALMPQVKMDSRFRGNDGLEDCGDGGSGNCAAEGLDRH